MSQSIKSKYEYLRDFIVNAKEPPEDAKVIMVCIIELLMDLHLSVKDISEKISAAAEG